MTDESDFTAGGEDPGEVEGEKSALWHETNALGQEIVDDAAWANLSAALRLPASGTLDGVRRLLGGFLREVLPPGVHAHGLVLDHVPYNGWGRRWRRWALRLGLWLVRKSGCEVVKP